MAYNSKYEIKVHTNHFSLIITSEVNITTNGYQDLDMAM